jgi:hypothetical protein
MSAKVEFVGMRFHKQQSLNLYKKDGSLKDSFKWPIGNVKTEDKSIIPVLEALAETELKGTIVIAYRKNENGQWDYCTEREGKAKGEWGGEQSAEAKAAEASKGNNEEDHVA